MNEQERVARFVERHDLAAPPAFRALDLVSEVGELAKELNESTGYGERPDAAGVAPDELGDATFALLALAERTGIDAGAALDAALAKYERRLEEASDPASGE